jgi:hypothetical protein
MYAASTGTEADADLSWVFGRWGGCCLIGAKGRDVGVWKVGGRGY